jgi:uncharacterized SAM-binding protein YcdF (DUF218 family)
MLIDILKFFLDPFNILLILLFITAGAWILKREGIAKWLMMVTGAWFLLISTPLVPVLLLNSLENQYEPIDHPFPNNRDAEYHIVVLGGGHGYDDRLPPNSLLSLRALARLNEGIRLHRELPDSKLLLSGSSSSGPTTQAEMLQETAILLGVNKANTLIQSEPANTHQEAQVYTSNYGNTHPVILVTSAAHMPRAVILFNNFGIDVQPSPTNYRLIGDGQKKRFGLPSLQNISHLETALKEYAGIFQAKYLL